MQHKGIKILFYQLECNWKLLRSKICENLCVCVCVCVTRAFGRGISHTFSFWYLSCFQKLLDPFKDGYFWKWLFILFLITHLNNLINCLEMFWEEIIMMVVVVTNVYIVHPVLYTPLSGFPILFYLNCTVTPARQSYY